MDKTHLLSLAAQPNKGIFILMVLQAAKLFFMPLQSGHYTEVDYTLNHLSTEQSRSGKAFSKNAKEGGGGLTWVFATEDISNVKEKFGRSAIKGHGTRPKGRDLRRKQIGVNEITGSREFSFFIQWLIANHPLQDGKAVAAIEKITIADTDHLSDYWFKPEILDELNSANIEFVDP